MKNHLVVILIALNFFACTKNKFETVYKGYSIKGKHSRGIDVSSNSIVMSGAKGSFVTYSYLNSHFNDYDWVADMEDFRDVHINPDGSILLLNSGLKGEIWKISTTGKQKLVYTRRDLFLDGFAFKDSVGFAYGDPVNDSTFFILKTSNYGESWQQIPPSTLPLILEKEAGFAASGTGIQMPDEDVVFIATGVAKTARIFRSFDAGKSWDVVNTPMKSGDHYGIYSMSFKTVNEGFIVGGSYKDTSYNEKICFYTNDKGETWKNRSGGLPGYMSCIDSNVDLSLIVTTGRLGTYYSTNKGEKWKLLTNSPYYSCRVTENQIILGGRFGTFELINYKLKL